MIFEDWEDPIRWNRYVHNGQRSSLAGVLVSWEYPYQGVVAAYNGHGGLEKRGDLKSIRPLDVAWRVPITFLQRFFDDDFWKSEVQNNGNALWPKCSTGYCFRVDRKGFSVPVTSNPRRDAMHMPPGYRQLKSGDIVPDQRLKRVRQASGGWFVDTTGFWRTHAEKYASGRLQRPWIAVPFEDIPVDYDAMSEASELSDPPSDMDIG